MAVRVRELSGVVSAPWRAMLNASPVSSAGGGESARFLNPRGAIVDAAVDSVLGCLAGVTDPEALGNALEPYMKLQALEAQSDVKATEFLVTLKALFRDAVEIVGRADMQEAARVIERSLDEMIALAAGMYWKNRRLLVELRNAEERRIAVRNLKNENESSQPDGASSR
ncbi:MAG: hypothetical protein EPN93_10525 [Spirochaetes bacterium]|nr:MAG: hypothetical protein EPN93_10525 [Spirochaetota bacterium]